MASMASRGDLQMPPHTEHVWLPNGLMSMTLMLSMHHDLLHHQIWTQSSIYRIFWNDAWDSVFYLHQKWVSWLTFLWKNGAASLLHNSRRKWSLCHGAYWPHIVFNHTINDFALMFPFVLSTTCTQYMHSLAGKQGWCLFPNPMTLRVTAEQVAGRQQGQGHVSP